MNVLAIGGAVLLAWSGVIHLRLWAEGYENISVIGPLFFAQGIVGLLLALATAVFRRLALLAAAAGTLLATAAGLLLSVHVGLFGYRESLAVPYATSSLVIEFTGAAVLLMAAALVATGGLAKPVPTPGAPEGGPRGGLGGEEPSKRGFENGQRPFGRQ